MVTNLSIGIYFSDGKRGNHYVIRVSSGCRISSGIINCRSSFHCFLSWVHDPIIRGAFNNVSARRALGVLVPMCIHYV